MILLLSILLISLALAYFSAPLWGWFVALGVLLLGTGASVLWWVITVVLGVVFLHKPTRVKLVTQNLFTFIEKNGLLPKISDTEKTALRAGDVWVEGELFSGKPDFEKIFANPYPTLSEAAQTDPRENPLSLQPL